MNELIAFALPSPVSFGKGWGNGYVAVPKEHPFFGKSYTDIEDIDINGGLTYSTHYNPRRDPIETEGMWILGFDTQHSWDTSEDWPDKGSVLKEANRLKEQLLSINKPY